jgi:hypothetical protein
VGDGEEGDAIGREGTEGHGHVGERRMLEGVGGVGFGGPCFCDGISRRGRLRARRACWRYVRGGALERARRRWTPLEVLVGGVDVHVGVGNVGNGSRIP